ncbi:MAG: MFS transporter, partial [Bacteroidales bacterium]|nr:MFS transporter [Bacteroidales bacterium]
MATDTKTLKTSKIACWLALACLVVPMFGSYFFDDMFSTVSQIFKNPEMLQLGWNSQQFGFYAGGYSFLCVWGGLIICGILLDKFGVRLIGSVFVGMMVVGAAIVTCAISSKGLTPNSSLTIAYIGCMLFGLGSEIAGVAVTRSIAKWFKGKNVALAMGLQLAIARIGTGLAMLLSPVLVLKNHVEGTVYTLSETNKPAIVGLSLLFIGMILWAIFVAMDAKYDRQEGIVSQRGEVKEEDKFKFSDIFKVLGNPRFIMIALLCVFFYCCVISFKKFGTSIIIPRFGLDASTASVMISMIAFAPVIFTPLFGALVDKVGKATTWMILGAVLVFCAHLIIGFAPGVHFYGYAAIVLLGIGYSLVPSAMWPTVPKIIPEKNLGTAYSMIYWIQNMGMLLVPIFVGRIMKNYADKK